jgi:hypothetical protein
MRGGSGTTSRQADLLMAWIVAALMLEDDEPAARGEAENAKPDPPKGGVPPKPKP